MKDEIKALMTLVCFIVFILGMLLGLHLNDYSVRVLYDKDNVTISDVMGDDVHIHRITDTSYVVTHPKIIITYGN